LCGYQPRAEEEAAPLRAVEEVESEESEESEELEELVHPLAVRQGKV
jgi:hypothetical protein